MKAISDFGLLVLRLAIGVIMTVHGAQKLFGWFGGPGLSGFVGWMASMHVPSLFAWLAIIAEFCGGLALIFGVLVRLAALGIAVDMLVAILLVHRKAGFFMNWGGVAKKVEGWEYALLILAGAVTLALTGAGRFAMEARRGRNG